VVLGPTPDFTADMTAAEASVEKLAGFDFDAAAFGHGQPVTAGADALVRALAKRSGARHHSVRGW
jgi:hypothetical protein